MLSFATPWLLAAALALPALWLLLRITPPPPRRFDFPAIRLLFGLTTRNRTARSAPLWLVILRLTLAALLILGAAGPAWRRGGDHTIGPWLIVVDNGWSGAKHWPQRRQALLEMIRQAEHDNQTVTLLPTAQPADGGALALTGPVDAADAKGVAERLAPEAWPGDRAQAAKLLDALPHGKAMRVIWMSDGLDDDGAATLAARLETFGRLEIMLPGADALPQMLMAPANTPGGTRLHIHRFGGGEGHSTVRALDEQGRGLALVDVAWEDGARDATAEADWPSELKNRIARLRIEGEDSAVATFLLDGSWSRHPVGLVDDGAADRVQLLDDLFYGERAVMGFAEARHGSIDELLQRPLSLMILPDHGALPEEQREKLRAWVQDGGTLVRFAGPELAGNPDDLLPVRLRANERLLGSALSWAQPMAVAPMPDDSPFAGLAIPPDLTVSAQILAEPDITLASKSWARLTDGTPLVTGAPLGHGWLVLIHTTAWPGWSNLAVSGLFPEMLHRLLDRSIGVAAAQTVEHPLPLMSELDGQGHLAPPSAVAQALPTGNGAISPGPQHPPGYYGNASARRAVNLAPMLSLPRPMDIPDGAVRLDPGQARPDLDLGAWAFGLALLLLLADLAVAGGFRRAAMAALLLMSFGQAHAADDVAAALDARLAYVVTGDPAVDETSRAGLAALSRQLARRTTATLAEPAGVDPERDALAVYPLIYWPLTARQSGLSDKAQSSLNDFLRHGGMLLIDSRDGGTATPDRLRQLTKGIDIPPLAPVGDQHVLAKSFYLLHDFPGRLSGGGLYAEEQGDAAHDFVTSVLIGGNDWAAAWADDRQGNPMFPVVPGGEAQREMAFRFGINLVIYALTGSYKADQVHVQAILERMHR
jgi:hypothetical protein